MSRDTIVGFVGLGNLGQSMALRLAERGWALRVHDAKPERLSPLLASGATETTVARLAEAQMICFAVPDDAAIRSVLSGGLLERLGPDHTVVVHSTILPEAARELAATVTSSGASLVEAPVSGGAERARCGDLAVLVSGTTEAIAAARPLLDDLGSHVFELGEPGAASATKLANQLVMLSALAGVHEALQLTSHYGVAPHDALGALTRGTGDTWVGRNWGFFDRVAADYDAASVPVTDRPWSKDIWEILTAAREIGADLPLAGLLSQTVARTVESHAAASQKGMDA